MENSNYYDTFKKIVHRSLDMEYLEPPLEPEFRQSRDCLAQPILKLRRFPFLIGFIGSCSPCSIGSHYAIANIEHGVHLVIPKEEIKHPSINKAEFKVSAPPILQETPLVTIEDDSRKEKYHRKNIIEKRRRKK